MSGPRVMAGPPPFDNSKPARHVKITTHDVDQRGLRIIGRTMRLEFRGDDGEVMCTWHGAEHLLQDMMRVALGASSHEEVVDVSDFGLNGPRSATHP